MPTIIGVDEVGRGCVFGEVLTAAIILPEQEYPWYLDIKDSKLLSAKKREYLSDMLWDCARISLASVSAEEIDRTNILQATLQAMKAAVEFLLADQPYPDVLVLVDGNKTIPGLSYPQKAVIGGDRICREIAAASIVAKVARDKLMDDYAVEYPQYNLQKNRGYGTKDHFEMLKLYGPSPYHRLSFRGVVQHKEKV